jgi:two-component system, sensor histidine kinase PdtaS
MKQLKLIIIQLLIIFISHGQEILKHEPGLPVIATYQPASQYKLSWQRLLLQLSSTYFQVVKEGQVDLDSSLLYVSRSLGLSRVSMLAEGIDDPELLAQAQWIDRKDPATAIRLLAQTTGKKHLELLLLAGAYYAFQPHSYYRYRDSVEYFLNKTINESRILKEESAGRQALCLLGKMYVEANDVKRGDSVFNRVINESEMIADKKTEARAYSYRGLYMAFSPASTQTRISYLQKAATIYQELKDTEGGINALTNSGYLLITTADLQKAYDAFLKAFQQEESVGFAFTHYNTDALTLVEQARDKFGEPLKFALQTVNSAERSRDSIGWAYFYSRLAVLYKQIEPKNKERFEWQNKSLARFLLNRDPALYNLLNGVIEHMDTEGRQKEALGLVTGIAKTIPPVNFTELYFYHMALSNCYINLRQFELAKMHLSKADSVETKAEAFRGPLRRAEIFNQFANIYFYQGQYRKAKFYFEKYLSLSLVFTSLSSKTVGEDIATYRKLIYIDSVSGDRDAGLAHYKKYIQILDSNYRVSNLRQAEELQVIYQTQEKENQITVLNQQAKLEQANLNQTILIKNITIAGIVAALIIATLLYRQNKLKQKNSVVITNKNDLLQHLVTEKEWLLKEIHHRVKNNFQTVMGLLGTQAQYQKNDAAINAITDSQRRIQSMSLIHQRLYQSNNLSAINMHEYVHELIDSLNESFNTGNLIRFKQEIEPIQLDLAHSIPLGLILNEAITNSFKYAFTINKVGIITISFKNTSENNFVLAISDNGIGLSGEFNSLQSGSMGMNLMRGLSEEIGAEFKIDSQNGTQITVIFEYDPDTAVEIPQIRNKTIHSS